MRPPASVAALAEFGRTRLSKSFFMRDFLFSDIAAVHGLANVPDDPDLAVAAGRRLCEELLEPIQDAFGRIAVRSAYRSSAVNGLGSERQRAGKAGYNCASNAASSGGHIWDRLRADGAMGATACIIVPRVWDRFQASGDWRRLAWWIHDTLPYSELQFFPRFFAFNIAWSEAPKRTIHSYVAPKGCLTRPGMRNFGVPHEPEWRALFE